MKQPNRILVALLTLHLLAGLQGAETSSLHAAASDRVSARPELLITTLGFGSCARQSRPQPIWDTINAAHCDAFVLGGDNIYGDSDATVLGEGQWAWFERRRREPAEIRVVISSIQLISAEHGSEKWENFPKERARFLELLRRTQARGVVVISGDRHLAELSALTPADGAPYPLYDLTTSGLNQPIPQKPQPKESNPKEPETKPAAPKKPQVNRYRLHERIYTGSNFGLMRVKWDGPNPSLRLEVCGLEGEVVLARDIPLSELRPK